MNMPPKPPAYAKHLGPPQVIEADTNGIVPVTYAWPLTAFLQPDAFEKLKNSHQLAHDGCQWFVVAKQLTPEEIAQTCGPVNKIRLGPNQGFLSITFGKTTFNCQALAKHAKQLANIRPDLASNKPRKLTKSKLPTARPPARTTGTRKPRHARRRKR